MKLRPYQTQGVQDIYTQWGAGARVVLFRLPTGGGKTPTFGHIVDNNRGAAVVIAHRSELVLQSSLALAKYGVRHKIIGPPSLSRLCSQLHIAECGRDYTDITSRNAVAGVDTLINLSPQDPWFLQVTLWVVDEGHHLCAENKWGRAVSMFVNARGLAVTATPGRPDGKGLGRHADGLADVLIHGPEMHRLTQMGYLTPYKIYCPPSDVNMAAVHVTASGEFNPKELAAAVHGSSTIVGDVVQSYLKVARGKLGITFAVDIAAAAEIAEGYRKAGVPAELLTGKTPPLLRAEVMRKFKRREILQLVNVDILGEGVDVPAVEVVSMARPTNSFITYAQQFGRMVRLFLKPEIAALWDTFTDDQRRDFIASSEKPFGILLDHVGNVVRHGGPPDVPRTWTLDRREKRAKNDTDDVLPLKVCVKCTGPYTRDLTACPYCGHVDVPAVRNSPAAVDGDLVLLDPDILAKMRGEIARIDGAARVPQHLDGVAVRAVHNAHFKRQVTQAELRRVMSIYGGYQLTLGATESQCMKRFYLTFGIDVVSAQALGVPEAQAFTEKIKTKLDIDGIVSSV